MLFVYSYVPHSMEKMQTYIDFIFLDVWCKAPRSGEFHFQLFNASAEVKELIEALHYSDTQSGDLFLGRVQSIYDLFATLTPLQVSQLEQWYHANNSIEQVCSNDPTVQIALYSDIDAIDPDLSMQLALFFKALYSQQLLDLAALRERIGEIREHYEAFVNENRQGKCPFCGLNDMKGIHNTKREPYDHYLPKALYPFNSINFRNLVPACHECNSTYKLSRDPAHNSIGRRKAFYPYTTNYDGLEATIDLIDPDIDRLAPTSIRLTFGPAAFHEEIETWKELYGIDERYKAKCCSSSSGKYWLTQVLDEWLEDGRLPIDYLHTLNRLASRSPFADENFLKRAFLEGCQRAGVFDIDTENAEP